MLLPPLACPPPGSSTRIKACLSFFHLPFYQPGPSARWLSQPSDAICSLQKKCNKAGPGEPSESKSLDTPHQVSQKEHGDKTQRGRAVTRVSCAIPLPVHRAATGGFFFFFPHFSAAEPSPAGCPGALTRASSAWSCWHLIGSSVALWVCWRANNLLHAAVSMLSC